MEKPISTKVLTFREANKHPREEPENLSGELWKSLDFMRYSNYSVSNKGRVKNEKTKETFLGTLTPRNYRVTLIRSDEGKRESEQVHILIASAFLENTENKLTVNHKNKIRHDNRVENLEWATSSEQNIHKGHKRREFILIQDQNARSIKVYKTIKEAIKEEDIKLNVEQFGNHLVSSRHMPINTKYYSYLKDGIFIPQHIKETWKDANIEEYPQLRVSDYGRVFYRNKILTLHYQDDGYFSVSVYSGKKFYERAHRLVTTAFYGPNEKLCSNHINGIKIDNRAENLEWVTKKENNIHAINTGLKIQKYKKIAAKNLVTNGIEYYKGLAETAEKTGYCVSRISHICSANKRGIRQRTQRYDFWYVDD